LFERYAHIVETGQGDEVELEYHSEEISGWFRNIAVKLGDGVAISFSDITERKQMEEALRESERKYKTAVQNIPGMVYRASSDWKAEIVSEAEILCGYTKDEINSMPRGWLNIVHPDDRDVVEREGAALACECRVIVQPYRIIAKNGQTRWVEDHKASLYSKAGAFEGIEGVVLDITERKHAEEALQASEKKFRALFEHASDAVTLVDAAGNIVFESPSITRITGYIVKERLNMYSFEVLHPDDRETAQNAFGKLLQIPGGSATMEFRVLHKDGSYRYMDCTATNLLDEPAIRAVVVNFRDITDRKQAEEKLQEANKLLEEQLGEIKILQDYLREQAVRDPLTGLYNRLYLYTTMEREFARAKRENSSVSVMMIDIDHFKDFNDTHGHQAGDEVLIALGGLLRKGIRQGDIACRYGGEEFIVIMPGVDEADAERRAEAIRRDFNNLCINYGGGELFSAISIGVAFYPQHGNSMNEIVKAADTALYEAKQAGRNRVRVWKSV
jgi:diguanylate cyclase (GGDEF)-like protein/PAS domain S-box-containing protein